MKITIAIALCLLACASAAPASSSQEAQVLRFDSDVQPEGYKFTVETSDGKSHQEEGQLKNVGTDQEALSVQGSYSWVDEKTGEHFTVNYLADENGFQPQGAHLPKAVQ